ncbi:hypothetical protein J3366_04060 [Tritonibacter mobilis]|uniref:hypothetical protein n=1 Tax=Tritonibacter mobilis TaxID=379347 RepID=UPI003BAC06C0
MLDGTQWGCLRLNSRAHLQNIIFLFDMVAIQAGQPLIVNSSASPHWWGVCKEGCSIVSNILSTTDYLTKLQIEAIKNCSEKNGLRFDAFVFEVVEDHGYRGDDPFMRKGIIRLRYDGAPTANTYTISEASSHMAYILSDIKSGNFKSHNGSI